MFRDIPVKFLIYNEKLDKLTLKLGSKCKILKSLMLDLSEIYKIAWYVPAFGVNSQIISLMKDILDYHKYPYGLYVHAFGVNGTTDSIVLM